MGQVNLYKIDGNKKDDFLDKLNEKFEFIGEQDYSSLDNEEILYTVSTYVNVPEERKPLEWQWLLDEYDYEIEGIVASPRAVLVIESEDTTYAVTYAFLSVCLLPVEEYIRRKDALENAWNIIIRKIEYNEQKSRRHIIIKAIKSYDVYPEKIPWKDSYLSNKDFLIKLGRNDFDEEVTIDISHLPHVLLAAGTGGGKTSLLNLILKQCWLKQSHLKQNCLGIIDFKGGMDYLGWKGKVPILTTPEECLDYLNELIHILDERTELLVNARVTNIQEYNQKAQTALARIIVVFDEIADVLGVKKKTKTLESIQAAIDLLCRKGRALGLHCILCYQRASADVLPGDIKANLGIRICGASDKVMSAMVLDNYDAAEMIPPDKKGYFVTNRGELFLAYFYDANSNEEEHDTY